MILGESQLNSGQSCKDVQAANRFAVSRIYWIQHACSKPFQVYCDMETHGGGWTLVYSYTFRNYNSFEEISNAVTPCPNWPVTNTNVPISTTPPLSESSLEALDWKVWKDVGEEFLVKSTVNDWIVCQPNAGSIVTKQDGSVSCKNIKNVATACSSVVPNEVNWWRRGLALCVSKQNFYYFEGSTDGARPVHDPCGMTEINHKKGVSSPGGQIYLR